MYVDRKILLARATNDSMSRGVKTSREYCRRTNPPSLYFSIFSCEGSSCQSKRMMMNYRQTANRKQSQKWTKTKRDALVLPEDSFRSQKFEQASKQHTKLLSIWMIAICSIIKLCWFGGIQGREEPHQKPVGTGCCPAQ